MSESSGSYYPYVEPSAPEVINQSFQLQPFPAQQQTLPAKTSWSRVVQVVCILLILGSAVHICLSVYYMSSSSMLIPVVSIVNDGVILVSAGLGILAGSLPSAANCYLNSAILVALLTLALVIYDTLIVSPTIPTLEYYLNDILNQLIPGLIGSLLVVVIFLLSCFAYVCCAGQLYLARKSASCPGDNREIPIPFIARNDLSHSTTNMLCATFYIALMWF